MTIAMVLRFKLYVILAAACASTHALAWAESFSTEVRGVGRPITIESDVGARLQEYSQSVALLIGSSEYTGGGWDPLPTVMDDLDAVGDALVEHGFRVEIVRNLSSEQLDTKLTEFRRNYGGTPNSRLLVYFAGHGISHPKADLVDAGWIIPSDAPHPSLDEETFWRKAISMDFMSGYARGLDAKHVLFVFDSCFSGSIFVSNARAGGPSPALAADIRAPVRYFITAGEENEYVHAESKFREEFVNALKGESVLGDFGDGYITAFELGQYLRDQISRQTSMHKPAHGALPDRAYNSGQFVFKLPSDELIGPYFDGVEAYQTGNFVEALTTWRAAAIAGDIPSRKILGDLYSGKALKSPQSRGGVSPPLEIIPVDNLQALIWYTLAALAGGAFDQCLCEETKTLTRRERYLAKIASVARSRVDAIKSRMSSADIHRAAKAIASTYQAGNARDLYELAQMYQSGRVFEKNNVNAALYYALASERGLHEAGAALEFLEPLMTRREIEAYQKMKAGWQPPLPPDFDGRVAIYRSELKNLALKDTGLSELDIDTELIQLSLRSLSYYEGLTDGKLNTAESRTAIRRFQYATAPVGLTPDEANALQTGILTDAQTVELLDAAASVGLAEAQYVLGMMFVNGVGVHRNPARGIELLTQAALNEYPQALYALGVLYRDGVPTALRADPETATSYFVQAAAIGYEPANEALRNLEFEATRDQE